MVRSAKFLGWVGVTAKTTRMQSDDPLSCLLVFGRLRLQSKGNEKLLLYWMSESFSFLLPRFGVQFTRINLK